ncbi:hypothetical protein J5N97_020680 [Dioscorea zingiberensis]|uniref:Uncharacterized protein n=1 Tax=Dioscorea zingiberensis TaxID=325984 RepID=A0A9D5HDG8_9LILI|nr:hypothetical protein J5N97_020680 [Dioscorea zingiberensis]
MRFVNTHLPSDMVVEIWEALFHLHKFPPLSKCGKGAHTLEESENTRMEVHLTLDGCPGGLDTFINAAKICYGFKVELSPTSILVVYCVAEFLGMTDEFGEEKLLAQAEAYFHKVVLRNWNDCIVALQSADNSILQAESLQIVHKCLSALSIMVCTDPSLFGWPMMMYRSLQSIGGNKKSEVELNEATLVTTLSACVSLGDWKWGRRFIVSWRTGKLKATFLLTMHC